MAFNPSSFLLDLSPTKGIGIGDIAQISAQRQQMKLAREKFEFDKKQAEEEKRLRELEEQGRAARAAMEAEQERARAERERQATLLAKQQEGLMKFGEVAGAGKVQAADAMTPYLDQLGYDVNNLGSVGGLPVYQLLNRAQEAERAAAEQQARASGDEMAGLGYPTNERGNLDDPSANRGPLLTDEVQTFGTEGGEGDLDEATADALMPGEADLATAEEFGGGEGVADVSVGRGIGPASLSTGDAFAQALAAHRYAKEHGGQAARGPDEEDYMGAVPRNVIDLPAMQAQTLARLNPALQARVAALPKELQEGAAANAKAIGGLGYETDAALKEFDTAMQDPVSIYNSQQNLLAQKEKDERSTAPTLMEISTFRERGAKTLTDFAKDRGVTEVLNAVNKADELLRVIDDPTPENDAMIAPALMAAQGVKGVPSNVDLQYAFKAKSSLIGDVINAVEEAIQGGLSTAQREAIKAYLQATKESQRKTVDDYLDNAFNRYDSGELNEYEKKGYLGALEQSVPASWHNDYWNRREKREGKGARSGQAAPAGAAGKELQRQAEEAGLDGQVLGKLMGGESGGKTNAASDKSSAKGVFQLLDSTAQDMGYENAAAYSAEPLEKQIEVGLKLFKNKGLTKDSPAEDYALVLAAPSLVGKWKSRDDVVYKKGSAEWEANAPWRPASGGDITVGSITDYYLKAGRERAAELERQDSAASKAESKTTELKMPEPKTAAEKRIIDLLKKAGG